jgi:UDP-N-acetylmuramyl-tripeptide synthetase
VGYGLFSKSADFQATNIVAKADGTRFEVHEISGHEYSISLPVGGLFNVSNALAAIASTRSRGVSIEAVQQGLANLAPVPGRFEPVSTDGKDFHVLVDYAHTPDGLENVLKSARALSPNRVVVVFGCGGNRDRTKRPIMGKIASDLADQVVVTSDNPRNEDPMFIISEIMAGISEHTGERVRTIVDRREAITVAVCEIARPGDIVVIAGKGHETYQLVNGQSFPFDDRLVAAGALAQCS